MRYNRDISHFAIQLVLLVTLIQRLSAVDAIPIDTSTPSKTTAPSVPSTTPSASTTSGTASSSPSTSATEFETIDTNNGPGLDTSDQIALGVGLPFGILTLIGMALTVCLQVRRDKSELHMQRRLVQQLRHLQPGSGVRSTKSHGHDGGVSTTRPIEQREKRPDHIMPTKPAKVLLGDPAWAWDMRNNLRASWTPMMGVPIGSRIV